jgi:hypothetical protein
MKIEVAKNRIEIIQKRINEEDRKVWETCRRLYEGDRRGKSDDLHDVNLIWGTVRTLIPELFFNVPKFKLTAKHASMTEGIRAKNEALLNAVIQDKDFSFAHVIKTAILAAHISFGVVTWGCNSDFKPHPMAGQVMMTDTNGEPIFYPEKLAEKDSYFIKRVRAQDFYPDLYSGEVFEKLRYYSIAELMTKKRASEVYKVSVSKLEGDVSYAELDEGLKRRIQEEDEYGGTPELKDEFMRIRVYKMYDRERQKVYHFTDSYNKFLEVEEFPKEEPVAILKFNDKLDEFYPIPEIMQVKSLQYEIESASTMRSEHMNRSGRKIGVRKGALDPAQLAKLEDPYSHVVIEMENPTDVWAIDFGTCDASIYGHEEKSTQQFDQIIGVGVSARGGSLPKRTATAEIIQDKKLNSRQQEKLRIVKPFLSRIANGLLNTIQETLTLEREIEIIGPDEAPYIVSYIPGIDVHGDYDCDIDLAELAAPNEEIERAQWVALLDIFARAPMAFSDPVLVKETLKRFGIENKELINTFMRIVTKQMQMQAAGAMGEGKTGGAKGMPQAGIGQMMGATIAGGIAGGG